MTTEEIISKITSKDTTKVWEASCKIISLGLDKSKIEPLIPHLSSIIEKTKNLEMGGALASNQRFIDYAIKTIEFHRDNSNSCACSLYLAPESIAPDPNNEVNKNYITILDTITIENKWVDFYKVECKSCGQLYKVIEREYHFMWWGWKKWND